MGLYTALSSFNLMKHNPFIWKRKQVEWEFAKKPYKLMLHESLHSRLILYYFAKPSHINLKKSPIVM